MGSLIHSPFPATSMTRLSRSAAWRNSLHARASESSAPLRARRDSRVRHESGIVHRMLMSSGLALGLRLDVVVQREQAGRARFHDES